MIGKVYKYQLQMTDAQELILPSKPISAAVQGSGVVVYALFNEVNTERKYLFRIAGTGHPMEDAESFEFLATLQPIPGLFFHVFYKEV